MGKQFAEIWLHLMKRKFPEIRYCAINYMRVVHLFTMYHGYVLDFVYYYVYFHQKKKYIFMQWV